MLFLSEIWIYCQFVKFDINLNNYDMIKLDQMIAWTSWGARNQFHSIIFLKQSETKMSDKYVLNLFNLYSLLFAYTYYTSTKSWRGYIFTAVCLCVCVCVCLSVCLCIRHFLWTKFQPNGCFDLDAVFAKWLLLALAQTLLNLVTLGQKSRSQ